MHDHDRFQAARRTAEPAAEPAPHQIEGTTERPRVTLSYAQTLDGQLATRQGSSQWISGPESLTLAHQLRAEHDAIMVGIGTILADDPRLTVRFVSGRDPLRVIVDSTLRIPLGANVLAGAAGTGTLVVATTRAAAARLVAVRAAGAEVVCLPPDEQGHVPLEAALRTLAGRGVRSVMVEGGAALMTALLRARLVDRLVVCVAPKILGTGIAAVGDLGIEQLDHALRLEQLRVTHYGVDLVVDGVVAYRKGDSAASAAQILESPET